jgi:DNA-binding CsgD family transcriptional regulator
MLMNRRRFERVIDRIYEAAVRPELWRDVLGELADASGSFGAQMLHHRPQGAVLHAASSRLDPVLERFFADGWNKNNPRELRARTRGVALNEVVTDQDLFSDEELDRERWQTEFLDRFGLRWFLSFSLREILEDAPFYLTVERLKASERFGPDEVAMFGEAIPHVRRAIRLSTAVGAAAQNGMMDALSALNKAAILLDDLGNVVRTNAPAEALLGDGLLVSRRRLRADTQATELALQRLIDNICWAGAASSVPAVDSIAVRRRSGPPIIVQAAPLVNTARDIFQSARALIVLTPLHEIVEPGRGILKLAFGFTPTEVLVALQLMRGARLPAVAEALKIAPTTARTHLRSIFAKTNTHSQSELAVLLSRVGSGLAG